MIVTIKDDLSSNVTTDDGRFECDLPNYNPETLVPFTSAADVQAFAQSITNFNYFVPKVSDEEKAAINEQRHKDVNVARAKQELADSDWADLPSVRNAAIEPHLTNGDDFDAYRAALRGIVVSKPAVVETWPTRPQTFWSTEIQG